MAALKPCPNPACCEAERVGVETSLTTPVLSYVLCRTCGTAGPRGEFERAEIEWNAAPRPADIVAARIEGLREARACIVEHVQAYAAGRAACSLLDARIAELEATAPEVSEMRAKAEAFDAALAYVKDSNDDSAWWVIHVMEKALEQAKRKGTGT